MTYLLIFLGLAALLIGGELLVRGAVGTAQHLGVSQFLIGITLVGFGTSTPELVTSLEAALLGSPGIAIGNVMGSNIANALLILGTAAVIMPITCHPGALKRDGGMLVVATVILVAVALYGSLGRIAGVLFVALLIGYIAYSARADRRQGGEAAKLHEEAAAELENTKPLWMSLVMALIGIAATIQGAKWLVSSAITIAADAGVPDTVIGLTLVAVGTSLPELAASVMAALKGKPDLALGNVIGSNIYNILAILGITATVIPLDFPDDLVVRDLAVVSGSTVLLLVFARTGLKLTRGEGCLFLLAYCAYLALLANAFA